MVTSDLYPNGFYQAFQQIDFVLDQMPCSYCQQDSRMAIKVVIGHYTLCAEMYTLVVTDSSRKASDRGRHIPTCYLYSQLC